jgi:hypothetical protein
VILLDITVDGISKPISVTAAHPIWSEDRQAFVPAGHLVSGERLRTLEGLYHVKGITSRGPPAPVYNIEVSVDHTYLVTDHGILVHNASGCVVNGGRAGKQRRLKELLNDPNVSSADQGWIKQEVNQISRGKRKNVRVPPGKNMAHRRGYEARKGYGYEHSDLQDVDLHKLQHKHEGYR